MRTSELQAPDLAQIHTVDTQTCFKLGKWSKTQKKRTVPKEISNS